METNLPARFWANVSQGDGCWEWSAGRTAKGYGKCFIAGRQQYAHRVSYTDQVGPVPDGMQVDHLCFNHACVRPSHLRVLTPQGNTQHREGAQRNSTSGVRGVHPFGDGRWRVQVRGEDGRRHSGGIFSDVSEAERVAVAMRAEFMGAA